MITVTNVSLNFSGQNLFSDVNLKFTPGNCYGVIGANGAGKSTFLKILSGELDSTTGEVSIDPNCRMSVLKQDHFAYDEYTVLDTIIMGNKRLYDIMKEKDALYEKEDFSDEDGIKAAELEAEFAEMDGWEADSNASKLMQGLGLDESIMYSQMADLGGNEKVKVLLAQALLGDPDILILDEPTAGLDPKERIAIRNYIAELSRNKIILFATHVVSDIECIADYVLLLKKGEIIAMGTPVELIEKMHGKVAEITCTLDEVGKLQEKYHIGNIRQRKNGIALRLVGDELPDEAVMVDENIDLEDVYLYYFE